MATPFDSAGDLLSQYQLSDEERRRLLIGNVLLGLGGGLMSGNRGNMWGAAGSGAVQGAQLAQNAISDARRGKMDDFKMRMASQEYDAKNLAAKQAAQQQEEAQKALGGIFGGAPQLQNMGEGGPTPASAAAVAPPSKVEQYRQAAAFYAAKGDAAKAKTYSEIADKLEEEYSTTPQTVRGPDGKIQLAQFGKRGGTKIAEGMTPAEKLHFADTGGMAGVGLDPYSGAAVSAGLPKTMTPGETASNKLGWANYGLSAAAAARAADAANNPKPQWDSASGQFVFPPSTSNQTGAAVTPQGFTKPEKPLTETQSKATAYVNQMQNATQVLSALEKKGFTGNSATQQAAIVAAGTEGNWIPGSAAIPRWAAGEDAQRYENAELQWTEPVLRFLTGANAPKEEVKRNAATFFPRPGDGPDVIAQKAAARANMEQSIRLAAGSGSAKVPDRAGAKQVVRTGTEKGTGRKVVQYSDGTTEYQ